MQVLEDRVGRATTMLINMFDPEIITLGNRLTSLDRPYVNVPRKRRAYSFAEKSARILSALQGAMTLV